MRSTGVERTPKGNLGEHRSGPYLHCRLLGGPPPSKNVPCFTTHDCADAVELDVLRRLQEERGCR